MEEQKFLKEMNLSELKVDTFIIENDWIDIQEKGWGNGYAILPKGHPCFGMGYDEIYTNYNIHCDSELTFAAFPRFPEYNNEDYWFVGFDTLHHGDTIQRWPKERVQAAADKLAFEFLQIWIQQIRNTNSSSMTLET